MKKTGPLVAYAVAIHSLIGIRCPHGHRVHMIRDAIVQFVVSMRVLDAPSVTVRQSNHAAMLMLVRSYANHWCSNVKNRNMQCNFHNIASFLHQVGFAPFPNQKFLLYRCLTIGATMLDRDHIKPAKSSSTNTE